MLISTYCQRLFMRRLMVLFASLCRSLTAVIFFKRQADFACWLACLPCPDRQTVETARGSSFRRRTPLWVAVEWGERKKLDRVLASIFPFLSFSLFLFSLLPFIYFGWRVMIYAFRGEKSSQ